MMFSSQRLNGLKTFRASFKAYCTLFRQERGLLSCSVAAVAAMLLFMPWYLIAQHQRASESVSTQSLLWRISSKRQTAPSFVFGTIHLLCKEEAVLSVELEQVLDSCSQVYMEVDMDDPATLEAIASAFLNDIGEEPPQANKRRRSTKGKAKGKVPEKAPAEEKAASSLREELGNDYALVESILQDSLGISIAAFADAPVHSSMLAMLALQRLFECDVAGMEQALMEAVMQKRARNGTLEIKGLEQPEQQAALLKMMMTTTTTSEKHSSGKQIVALLQTLPAMRSMLRLLTEHYRAGRLDSLASLLNALPGAMATQLLTKRNHAWMPTIERAVCTMPTLIAVGAGHLTGSQGLLALLRKRGFRVEPIAETRMTTGAKKHGQKQE